MSISLANPLLVVSHDAGGAEVIAAWIRKHARGPYVCVAEGPARRVFEKICGPGTGKLSRDEGLSRLREFRTVLTGSSWGSDLEKTFVTTARTLGIRTITYLDHWTDYRERFLSAGRLVMPEEIWVGDEYAERLVRSSFPGQRVRNVGNYYLADVVERIRAQSSASPSDGSKKRVLFVSEPIAAAAERKYGDRNYYGYTERDAIAEFLKYARTHWAGHVASIRIRRHPSEEAGIFASYADAYPDLRVEESGDESLVTDCAWADWIVGCQSMAMVVGLMAGKRVFSAIPRAGRPLQIPYPGIAKLFETDMNPAE